MKLRTDIFLNVLIVFFAGMVLFGIFSNSNREGATNACEVHHHHYYRGKKKKRGTDKTTDSTKEESSNQPPSPLLRPRSSAEPVEETGARVAETEAS